MELSYFDDDEVLMPQALGSEQFNNELMDVDLEKPPQSGMEYLARVRYTFVTNYVSIKLFSRIPCILSLIL